MHESHVRDTLAAYSRQHEQLVAAFARRRLPSDVPLSAALAVLDALLNVPREEIEAAMNAARKARAAADDARRYTSHDREILVGHAIREIWARQENAA